MLRSQKSLLYGLISVLLWSTVATAFKIALYQTTYSHLLLFSASFSCLLFGILVVFSKESRYEISTLKFSSIVKSAILGFLNPFLYYLVLFKAYSLLKAQEALCLNYTWAIILPFLSILLQKKRLPFVSFVALFISFFGVLIIISKGSIYVLQPSNTTGAIFAFGSAFVWGFFWILNTSSTMDDKLRLFLNFAFGTAFTFFYIIIFEDLTLPKFKELIPIVYISICEMGVTFLLWNKALKLADNPAKISNLIYLSPLISMLFISTVLGEAIHLATIPGLILILMGVMLQNWTTFRTFQSRSK
jgi:drug/metabolite transporter (DMT)-like permease